jgi:CBS domain-containing protein
MSTKVRDVMTTRVVAVRKNATFKDMAALLTKYRVSAFPVLDDEGKVIGVVSEADLLSKEALVADMGSQAAWLGRIAGSPYHDEFAKAAAITATDLMTKPPVVVTPDEPVTSAARLMYHGRVKRLPVVGEKGQLIGIVSRADVLSVYRRPDEEIQQEIIKNVIMNEFFADPDHFVVAVKDGLVTLEGYPESVAQGRDIVVEAWHIEGVVSVRDRLTYPEGK